jgi:hypothetical protein
VSVCTSGCIYVALPAFEKPLYHIFPKSYQKVSKAQKILCLLNIKISLSSYVLHQMALLLNKIQGRIKAVSLSYGPVHSKVVAVYAAFDGCFSV